MLTGTIRLNSLQFPKSLSNSWPDVQNGFYLKKNELQACAFKDKPTQKRPVLVLTSAIDTEINSYRKRDKQISKPSCITSYNKGMGGVDLMDKKVCHYAAERPTHRYWVKIFRNLMDIALLNSYELYKIHTTVRLDRNEYIAQVVESLCGTAPDPPNAAAAAPATPPPPPALVGHQIAYLPGRTERQCVVCSDRKRGLRRRSRTYCPGCDVGVHKTCFDQLEHVRR